MTKEEYKQCLIDAAVTAADETDFVSDLMEVANVDQFNDCVNDWYNDDVQLPLIQGFDQYLEEDYVEWPIDDFMNDELIPNMEESLSQNKQTLIKKYAQRLFDAGCHYGVAVNRARP